MNETSGLAEREPLAARSTKGKRRVAALALAGMIVSTGVTSTLLPAAPASAESSSADAHMQRPQTQFAYLAEGDALSVSFVSSRFDATGVSTSPTFTIVDPDGNVQWSCEMPEGSPLGTICAVDGLTGPAGVWEIRITDPLGSESRNTGFSWDTQVSNGGTPISGRIFTTAYGLWQTTPADMDLWVVNNAGYQYEVSLLGYNGVISTLTSDATGNPDPSGECSSLFASYDGLGLTAGPDCEKHRIFFSEPAADLPETAPSASGIVPVLPAVLDADALEVSDTQFFPAGGATRAGAFDYSINPAFTGHYWFEIDTNSNGSYLDPEDVRLHQTADGSGSYTTDFDGLDGAGEPVGECSTLNARVYFDTVGETHLRMDDVEGLAGGLEVTRLNGAGAPDSTLFWDDTPLTSVRANTTPQIDGTAGTDSSGGVHGWAQDGNSWGNERQIDNWAFAPIDMGTGEITIAPGCLAIDKSSNATETSTVGDTVTYKVLAMNLGGTDFTAENPAVVSDDLSGVLDDATFNNDAVATIEGELDYTEPRLTWTGPLAAGEMVTLTYSVTLQDGGDGVVRNVAFEGETVPDCAPPVDGRDEETGIPCAEVEFPLTPSTTPVGAIEVTKSADPESGTVVADGKYVTYSLLFSNTTTDTSADPIAVDYVDHLKDVLDDATFVEGSIKSNSALVATLSGDKITVVGSLASGGMAQVTYTVIVKDHADQGNHLLANVVVPAGASPDCDAAGAACTEHPTEAGAGSADPAAPGNDNPAALATTGGTISLIAGIVAVLFAAGGAMYIVSRRRTAALQG